MNENSINDIRQEEYSEFQNESAIHFSIHQKWIALNSICHLLALEWIFIFHKLFGMSCTCKLNRFVSELC